jgi:hypothetical protein
MLNTSKQTSTKLEQKMKFKELIHSRLLWYNVQTLMMSPSHIVTGEQADRPMIALSETHEHRPHSLLIE